MSIRLYDIPTEWQKILQVLEENCGELTPEIEAEAAALITASKDKLEAAGLAKRNLEMHALLSQAQAKVFSEEAARCSAMAKSFEAASDALGTLMAPALEITGKIKTVAGTLYTQTRTNWSFELKPGKQFFDLPQDLWRQKEPELNKLVLKKLAEGNELPEEILAMSTSNTSVCLKAPTVKKDAEATPAIAA